LRHEEHHYGYLGVSVPASLGIDEQELSLLEEVAGDLGFALHGLETEEAQRESEQSLRTIFDSALDGILVADAETQTFMNANRTICRMLGYSFEELMGLSLADIHPPENLEQVTAEFEKQVQNKTALAKDIPVKRKDGSVFYTDVNSAPIELGGRTHLLGVFRDVTERRHSEQELRNTNKELQETQQRLALQARWVQALNSVASDIARRNSLESILRVVMHYLEESFAFAMGGIGLRSEDGAYSKIVALSSQGRSLASRLGVREGMSLAIEQTFLLAEREATEPLTVSLTELNPTDLPATARELVSHTQRQGFKAVVVVPLASDRARSGELFMLYKQAVSLSEPELGFLRGMAEYASLAVQNRRLYDKLEDSYKKLQAAQQAMMQQERLKAMGQMASGIAHDINNTLAPVTLYTEALSASELGQKEPARRYLSTIQSAIGDIVGITTRLRAFYKVEEQSEVEALDIRELFDSVLELSRPRWKDIPNRKGVEIRMQQEVASRLPPLLGNLTEVREALINLVFNAVDALPQGGTITLRARKMQDLLCLEVADSGVGMTEEQKRRCIEPFYTTKGAEGSGLGLSVVFGAIQRYKGKMEIESEPGKGTTVRLLFPVPRQRVGQSVPGKRTPVPKLPRLRILCIDDDRQVREALKAMLSHSGHQVEVCADGEEALAAFRSGKAAETGFDVVITDLGMPHMDGKTLAREIKELSPSTPVILLSGWGNFMNLDGERPEHVDCLLGKPPTLARLLAAIREVLKEKQE
jgi:PAS domain S-box-containing protein